MSYPGSKGQAGVFQRIIGQMPPHSVYVEPFAGSAQVFFRKRPARFNILIDRSAGVVASLRDTVRDTVNGHGAAVDIVFGNALEWVKLEATSNVPGRLIYCDPPYLLSTRRSRRYYEHEMSDDDHAALLSALVDVQCYAMISGYPSELYSSRLRDWRCISYRTRTRGRTVTECLWCNFPEPVELHDWRFAGRNRRQRYKWGLVAERFFAKLEKMPALKRGYLLNSIERHLNGCQRIPTPLLASIEEARRRTPKLATVATARPGTPEMASGAV